MIKLMDKVVDGVDVYYPLDLAKEKFEIKYLCEDGYLILHYDEVNPFWLKFAVMEFGYSLTHEDKEDEVFMSCLFYGEGPTGGLNECRHTYWGDGGYIFYPNAKIITAGLKALEEFFDMD
jgi:hypothetical protein